MKKYLFFALMICMSGIIIYSCSQDNNLSSEFTPIQYDVELYGPSMDKRASGGQTTCSCSLGSTCSASKTCPSGKSCSCTCEGTRYGSKCSCGPCSGSGIAPGIDELYYTEAQLGYWNQMQGILVNEVSNASQQAQGYQLDALQAVVDNDFTDYGAAKDNFDVVIHNLNNATKAAINNFYDQHGFTDERL